MRTMLIVGFGLLIGLVGCEKGANGAAPAASGAAPAASGAATSGAQKTSLTQAQLEEAYKLADADNYDKSVAAVTGKLGAPQKTEPDTSIWYGVSTDGSMCSQLKLTKARGNETGTVDKANCGIK